MQYRFEAHADMGKVVTSTYGHGVTVVYTNFNYLYLVTVAVSECIVNSM